MKKHVLFWILLSFSFVGFISSCSNDEDNIIRFATTTGTLDTGISNLKTNVGGSYVVIVSGGKGGYRVVSDKEEIVSANIEHNTLIITAHRIGNANLTVFDKSDRSSVLTIIVEQRKTEFFVQEVEAKIEAGGQIIDEGLIEQIKNGIKAQMKPVGSDYTFYFNKEDEGELTIHLKDPDETIHANFSFEKNNGKREFLKITYGDGKTDSYRIEDMLLQMTIIKDFKQDYPNLNLVKAEGVELLVLKHPNN